MKKKDQLNKVIRSITTTYDFARRCTTVIRKARDYVIDAKNLNRTTIAECEKAEKTIFGMKVEAYLRNEFVSWEQGDKLDFKINGVEVDSKATVGKTWMIPQEAVGEICLLTNLNEKANAFKIGLLIANKYALSNSCNQDRKHHVSARGKQRIHWLVEGTY